ncbi:hypothetical protein PMAYCL1PPCAC_31459, partial [Pristionchus mayeri]
PHFPTPSSSSSSCLCHLCEEPILHLPSPSVAVQKMQSFSGYSIDAILNLEAKYAKIRKHSWVCDEMCTSIVAFLLSPTGRTLEVEDPLAVRLHGLVQEICCSSSVCPSHHLILRLLVQKPSDPLCFPW